ncbi:MAG: septum formation initiator family protein [Candidatus Omnitrophota bacterium]
MVERLLGISRNKWVRISALIFCLSLAAIIIYFPNYIRLKTLRDENKRIDTENQELLEEIADYEEKLQRVGKDPYLYEKIARDELGIAKEDEIVIDIEE